MLTIGPYNKTPLKSGAIANMDKHERLRSARKKAGYRSAAAAADALGMSHSTYQAHENSNRNYDAEDAVRYARRFRVSPNWLLYGTEDQASNALGPEASDPLDTVDLSGTPFDDVERFKTAYRRAKEIEKARIGGRGSRLSFASLVWAIYEEEGQER